MKNGRIFSRTIHFRGKEVKDPDWEDSIPQIYAVAILWALALILGHPLPIIVDTPLGRLDSDHRTHLIERYFPFASHQVLILSTDTELDEEYYQVLKPSISHAFHLEFDNKAQATQVKQGYFWTE